MANYHGVGVCFGVTSSIANVTGAFQTRDHTIQSENEIIRNGIGDPVAKTYYGQFETAVFEYVATATTGGTNVPTYPSQSMTATVTDAVDTPIAGTTWLVDKVVIKGSNTTSTRVTVDLWRAAGITS